MTFFPQSILIVLHGSIGDVTRALPLANLLRRGFPSAKLAWSIEPAALSLVENHPAIDEVIVFDRENWRESLMPFLRRIRGGRFDLVLDLQRHLKSGFISWWSGAPRRIGFNRADAKELNWLFNNQHIAPGGNQSKLNHYLMFLDFLHIRTAPLEWEIPLAPPEAGHVEKLVREVGAPFVAYCAGSRWQSKRWFADEAAKSAAEVNRRYGFVSVILGGEEDHPFAVRMQHLCETPLFDFTGRTSLREAVGILRCAELSIGPDSGLMHLSAAVGTPVISLWGATDPKRTGPHGFEDLVVQGSAPCVPCYVRECPIGRICMRSITSEEVLARIDAAIGMRRQARGASN